jgi:GNAT superfamily N-acetyltransferase
MNQRIVSIADVPEALSTIIEWERNEWGDEWADIVAGSTTRDDIPTIFVALEDEKPVGCAMLIKYDMMTRKDLTPWIGGVFVHPDHRNQGIASSLMKHALEKACALNIPTWWLYTASSRELYARLGWQYTETATYDGVPVTIMRYDFR